MVINTKSREVCFVMLFQSFLLGNLVSVGIKILNSVVVVGLYYGFLTTFSIGPSYLFLLRARFMEEETEKMVSATTGFLMGQLMMFVAIYYAPLHLALGRPHTITALVLPYLLFQFFWDNHKHFFDYFDYGSTTRNSMRNFSIQCVFLNSLICQFFNHFILPSSMVAKLVNIYMFRCNNKMLFVTSSFVGWLIGQILFLKWLGLVLVWLRQNQSIRSNKYLRLTKYRRSTQYLLAEWRDSTARIFTILFFITCGYYLGRAPLTKRLKAPPQTEQRGESEEERDVEIETASDEEDLSPSFFSEEKADPNKIDATEEIREQPLVNLIFDAERWNQPFRYITNTNWDGPVRQEMSQYFFDICPSDGKEKISFTHPPGLSRFLEVLNQRISPLLYETWLPKENYIEPNKENYKSFKNELKSRIEALDNNKKFRSLNILETRTRLCHDIYKKKYLAKNHDPFLNNSYRKRLDKNFSPSPTFIKQTRIKHFRPEVRWGINRLHGILLSDPDGQEQDPRLDRRTRFENQPLLTATESVAFLTVLNEVIDYSRQAGSFRLRVESGGPRGLSLSWKVPSVFPTETDILMYHAIGEREGPGPGPRFWRTQCFFADHDNRRELMESIFTFIVAGGTDQTFFSDNKHKIRSNRQRMISKVTRLKQITKQVLRRSSKLITELDGELGEYTKGIPCADDILSRGNTSVVIFSAIPNAANANADTNRSSPTDDQAAMDEVSLVRYYNETDFHRALIKGSLRSQRRKVVIFKVFQAQVHSPLFMDRLRKLLSAFEFDISGLIQFISRIRNRLRGGKAFKIVKSIEEQEEEIKKAARKANTIRDERVRLQIAKDWDTIPYGQPARGCILLTQSIFRKYILLPSFIIVKNVGRILLFQFPEWFEDFDEWAKEVHVRCTVNGVPVSETGFPEDWLSQGIQIKLLFPFRLKAWNKSKLVKKKEQQDTFCFLTVWGMETDRPFGSPRNRLSFLKPIFTQLKKQIGKFKKKYFGVLLVKKKFLGKHSKEAKKGVIKSVGLKPKKIKEFSINESRELKEEKDALISNQIIHESLSQVVSPSWTNSSFTEKKMNALADQTNTIRNEIETISKEKTKVTPNRFEKWQEKWQIVTRRNARIICKLPLFFQVLIERIYFRLFIERIYTDIFVAIINIPKKNTKLFLQFKKKIIEKSISNNSRKQEIIKKKKKNPISFISKSLDNSSNSQTNSHSFYDLSDISQAYVFYKLSKIQVSHSSKLRSVLYYQGIPFFPKPEIKDSFEKRGVVHSKLGDKKFPSYEMNQWKNWLRGHYQYHLSEKKWSRLIQEKWRNALHKHHIAKKEIESKRHSYEYEKDPLIDSNKQFEVDSLSNQKETFQKDYRYDLLSYKLLDYENKTEYFFYRSPFQGNKKKGVSSTSKETLLHMPRNIPSNNYLNNNRGGVDTLYMKKVADRDDFESQIISNNSDERISTSYLMIPEKNRMIPEKNPPNSHKEFYDWMGMNKKLLKQLISTLESWFFPKFVFLCIAYRLKPWFLPTQLVLLDWHRNENPDVVKMEKMMADLQARSLGAEKYQQYQLGAEKYQQYQEEPISPGDRGSVFSQDSEGNDVRLTKKKYHHTAADDVDDFVKRFLLFQLRWDESLTEKMINNIRVYCLLLKFAAPRNLLIASIQKKDLSLDIMLYRAYLPVTELMKRGVLVVESPRLPGKKDGQFSMYQTIGILLIHKSKHHQQTKQKYQEQVYVSKNQVAKAILTQQRISKNRDKKKNRLDFLVPEKILSFKRRKKLRILICFNSKTRKNIARNPVFWNDKNLKNSTQVSHDNKHLDKEKNQLMRLKLFLWPNYRFEDFACMNRYWFNTNNGSRFSMLRIQMYPRLKIYGYIF